MELTLAATGVSVDFLLPLTRPIYEYLPDMSRQIEQLDPTVQFERGQPMCLCDLEQSALLDLGKALGEQGVRNGARLSLC